jgi:hypothetical protein
MTYIKFILFFLIPCTVFSQTVTIPDPVFKDRLLNHSPTIDTNSDGEIQRSEAEAIINTLNVDGMSGTTGITDLTGIEAFINIDAFRASNNDISVADFSSNTLLKDITMNTTILTNITLTNNILLRGLNLSDSELSTIDISNNPDLNFLQANFSNLTSLDTSNNPALMFLNIQVNQIASLNMRNNPTH